MERPRSINNTKATNHKATTIRLLVATRRKRHGKKNSPFCSRRACKLTPKKPRANAQKRRTTPFLRYNPVLGAQTPFFGLKNNYFFAHAGEIKKTAPHKTNKQKSRANWHENRGIPAMGNAHGRRSGTRQQRAAAARGAEATARCGLGAAAHSLLRRCRRAAAATNTSHRGHRPSLSRTRAKRQKGGDATMPPHSEE